jgi:hypothetical protein
MNWGKGLTIVMLLFMTFIITMAVLMGRIETNMVETDYYEKGLKQDEVTDMRQNFIIEDSLLDISSSNKIVTLDFGHPDISGEMVFYRPSDNKLDFKKIIEMDTNLIQHIDVSHVKSGLWKLKVQFEKEGKKYLTEKTIFL